MSRKLRPIILAGGVGNSRHLADGLFDERIDAVATAHLFNFVGDGLSKAREELIQTDCKLPKWDSNEASLFKNILDR